MKFGQRRTTLAILVVSALGTTIVPQARGDEEKDKAIREAVVKIQSTIRQADPTHPWRKRDPYEIGGSGVVIDGKRILTNAHVVMNATQVLVQAHQGSDKLAAKVEAIDPAMDLAILSLEDASFFDKRQPIAFSRELPDVKESVVVYGYPTGGEELSVTKGIVSRIEFTSYYYLRGEGLRLQVDAAINPGNSGGPALVDDKVVGLAFSGLEKADNIGYLIPTEEIETFLADIADGKVDGKPMLFDSLDTLENGALRGWLKLDKNTSGMIVHAPFPDESSPLREWDLIAKIGEHVVDNTGKVALKNNLRVSFQYHIPKLAREGKVALTVVRAGKTLTIDVPVFNRRPLVMPYLDDKPPSYFIHGPLVFTKATQEYIGPFLVNPEWVSYLGSRSSAIITQRAEPPKTADEEIVVVACQMFPHRITKGYSDPSCNVISTINDKPVKNLRHLVETLRDLKEKYVVIGFREKETESLVFDRAELERSTEEILADNGIRRACSKDIAPFWKKDR